MRGSVVKNGSRYFVKIELDPDAQTGKRRQKWHSGFRTKKEAERAPMRSATRTMTTRRCRHDRSCTAPSRTPSAGDGYCGTRPTRPTRPAPARSPTACTPGTPPLSVSCSTRPAPPRTGTTPSGFSSPRPACGEARRSVSGGATSTWTLAGPASCRPSSRPATSSPSASRRQPEDGGRSRSTSDHRRPKGSPPPHAAGAAPRRARLRRSWTPLPSALSGPRPARTTVSSSCG